MPEEVVNPYEAKTHLSRLVDRAASGETIIIAKAGKPLARLLSMPARRAVRLGSLRARIQLPNDIGAVAREEIDETFNRR
ncbi:MAG: type II toxin-antitoxin system prevent-host-death family antitoxin [Burkholderiaceae bacterium]|nr:type II toxin-antitoxin system prevent-host-death family antitoxin [Burkholderiaceae bacterium]